MERGKGHPDRGTAMGLHTGGATNAWGVVDGIWPKLTLNEVIHSTNIYCLRLRTVGDKYVISDGDKGYEEKIVQNKGVDRVAHKKGSDILEKVVIEGPSGLVTGARSITLA